MSFAIARLQQPDNLTQRSHDQLVGLGVKLDQIPFLNGVLVENVVFTTAPRRVPHGLGRRYRGFFVVKQSASGTLANTPEIEGDPKQELGLTSNANLVCSLWVF